MGRGRPIAPLALGGAERETLEQWTRRPKTAQALALRARIVLACADGRSNTGVAAELRVCVDTVGEWRSRFLEQRLDGLLDQPRSGRPRMIDDADVERVIALTLEATPKDATHWSTRSMARLSGLSDNTVSRIWRAFALQPHRTETFKLSADPLFIEKVRDIVGLYLTRRTGRWSCAWTRSPRSKPWTAPGRFCPCVRARPSGAPMITCATAPRPSSPLWTPGPVR